MKDGTIAGAGLALNAGALMLESFRDPADIPFGVERSLSLENPFDSLAVFPYSNEMDTISKILAIGALASPAVLAAAPRSDWFTVGAMYAESLLWAWGLKELGKNLIGRYRPYVYTGDWPDDAFSGDDLMQSFPSGHTTLAFTGAAFASFVFSRYYPDSPWSLPLTLSGYAMAAGAAAFRVTSGSHFITDAFAGAAIGIFAGYAVPWFHAARLERGTGNQANSALSLRILPSGIYASYAFPVGNGEREQ